MEFEPEKETFLQKIAFPCMGIAIFGPMAISVGIGYLIMNFFGRIDSLNQTFEKPIAALSLNDLLSAVGTLTIMFCFAWVGKTIGSSAMDATSDWFQEKEKSAMALTDEDIRVFECPQCKKSNTYRPGRGPDRSGKFTWICSTPDCGRERSENSLAREIHRKD